jgi:hypothetical protein
LRACQQERDENRTSSEKGVTKTNAVPARSVAAVS